MGSVLSGVAIVAALYLLFPVLNSEPILDVWPVDSLIKVFPDESPKEGGSSEASWIVPRNGHLTIQFAVRSRTPLSNLTAVVSPPKSGSLLLTVQAHWVGYVPLRSNTRDTPPGELVAKAPGLFPDPLLEDPSLKLPPGETHAIWVIVYCPPSAAPGAYQGAIEFRNDSRTILRRALPVRVAKAKIPERQTLSISNWFYLSPRFLNKYYPDIRNSDSAYWQLLENIGGVLADHKQNVLKTPITSLVDAVARGGTIVYRFDRFDRWVATFKKAGVLGTIEGGDLLDRSSGYHSGVIVPSCIVEKNAVIWKDLPPSDPRAEAFVTSLLSALYGHLSDKGWTRSYMQHILDEPHGLEAPVYRHFAELVHRIMPGVPVLDAVGFEQDLDFYKDSADVWVPLLGSFDDRLPAILDHVHRRAPVWFYTSLYPQGRYLNRFIDYPLLKSRLLPWLGFRYGLTGYLQWGGNNWGANPFEDVQISLDNGKTLLPAGDNAIVYPAPAAKTILSSIRLEALREGIEDYELLAGIAKNDLRKAQAIAAEAIPGLKEYVRTPEQFRRLRARLCDASP